MMKDNSKKLNNLILRIYGTLAKYNVFNYSERQLTEQGHVQNPPAIKIHPRSKSTQSNLRTAYQSRVRVKGNTDSEK